MSEKQDVVVTATELASKLGGVETTLTALAEKQRVHMHSMLWAQFAAGASGRAGVFYDEAARQADELLREWKERWELKPQDETNWKARAEAAEAKLVARAEEDARLEKEWDAAEKDTTPPFRKNPFGVEGSLVDPSVTAEQLKAAMNEPDAQAERFEVTMTPEQMARPVTGAVAPSMAAAKPKMVDGIPRRNRVDLRTPAETAIADAAASVEGAGAHVLLTQAINKLHEARELVADFVERDQ